MKQKLMRSNPAAGLEVPKVVKAKIEPSTVESVRAILEQAPADIRLLFQLDALTGLRRGEILALQWRDVDWLNSELIVERSIGRARATNGIHKYQHVVGSTKGGRSRRVGLAQMLLDGLKTFRSIASDPSDETFIFTRNGGFINPEYFSKWIALPLVKKASEGRIKRFTT
jgi:integrase